MKRGNKMIAAAKKKGLDISDQLIKELGFSKFDADWAMKWGFGLQNNNANMKRVEEMIKQLERKEELKNQTPITNYSFDGGILCVNYEIDRLQIFFNERPTKDQLQDWKNKGLNSYNWSPSNNAWQRKITNNAIFHVKRMLPKLTKI